MQRKKNLLPVQLHNHHLEDLLLPIDQLLPIPWNHLEHLLMLPLGQVVHQLDGLLDLEVLSFLMMNAVVPTDCQVPLCEESFLLVQVPLAEKSVLFFLMAVHMGFASVEILAPVLLSAGSFRLPDHELILLLGQNPPLSAKENQKQVSHSLEESPVP